MPAYLVADIHISDESRYAEYAAGSPATIAAFGGRYLARGGVVEILEGDWIPRRAVIVEFPDVDALRNWYESEAYQALKAIRDQAAISRLVVINGVTGPIPE